MSCGKAKWLPVLPPLHHAPRAKEELSVFLEAQPPPGYSKMDFPEETSERGMPHADPKDTLNLLQKNKDGFYPGKVMVLGHIWFYLPSSPS